MATQSICLGGHSYLKVYRCAFPSLELIENDNNLNSFPFFNWLQPLNHNRSPFSTFELQNVDAFSGSIYEFICGRVRQRSTLG